MQSAVTTMQFTAVAERPRPKPLLVIFSKKCFNPLNLHFLTGNILEKWSAAYFILTDKHLTKYSSSMVNHTAVTALLWTFSLCCWHTHYFNICRFSFILCFGEEIFVQINCIATKLCYKNLGSQVIMSHEVLTVSVISKYICNIMKVI